MRTTHPLGNSIQGPPHPHDENLKQGYLSRAFWQAPFPLFAFLPDIASDFLTATLYFLSRTTPEVILKNSPKTRCFLEEWNVSFRRSDDNETEHPRHAAMSNSADQEESLSRMVDGRNFTDINHQRVYWDARQRLSLGSFTDISEVLRLSNCPPATIPPRIDDPSAQETPATFDAPNQRPYSRHCIV